MIVKVNVSLKTMRKAYAFLEVENTETEDQLQKKLSEIVVDLTDDVDLEEPEFALALMAVGTRAEKEGL